MKRRNWLKQLRLEKGLTQDEVAKKVPITLRYYQMIEQGVKEPSVLVANRISEVIGFNWSEGEINGKENSE